MSFIFNPFPQPSVHHNGLIGAFPKWTPPDVYTWHQPDCRRPLQEPPMPKKPRNRSAQDATLINLRAMKKRLASLEKRVKALEKA